MSKAEFDGLFSPLTYDGRLGSEALLACGVPKTPDDPAADLSRAQAHGMRDARKYEMDGVTDRWPREIAISFAGQNPDPVARKGPAGYWPETAFPPRGSVPKTWDCRRSFGFGHTVVARGVSAAVGLVGGTFFELAPTRAHQRAAVALTSVGSIAIWS